MKNLLVFFTYSALFGNITGLKFRILHSKRVKIHLNYILLDISLLLKQNTFEYLLRYYLLNLCFILT